jgi:transcription-repair coupling factor (superfamily II helicase)
MAMSNRQIIKDTFDPALQKKQVEWQGACFIAGTLVHADKGLVPIEQLKVGDMVLSKPESGEGEQAYKRITRTFKSAEKKPILAFEIFNDNGTEELIFCTYDHPIWSYGEGWLPASQLSEHGGPHGEGNFFELAQQNRDAYFSREFKTAESLIPGVFFTVYDEDTYCPLKHVLDTREDGVPVMLYYSEHPLSDETYERPSILKKFKDKLLSSHSRRFISEEDALKYMQAIYGVEGGISHNQNLPSYTAIVYNIEVEDYHTYYAGVTGIWVHNCGGGKDL